MVDDDPKPNRPPSRKPAEELLRIERDLGIGLSVAESLGETLERAMEAALRVPPIDCGGVYLVDEATGEPHLVVHRGLSDTIVDMVRHFRLTDPEIVYLTLDRPIYGRAEQLAPRLAEAGRREGLRGLVVIPVKDQGRAVGSLVLASRTQDDVDPVARDALEAISSRLGGVVRRVRAEEDVARSKEMWERTFDAAPDLIAILDCNHRIVRMNKAMATRLGVEPDQWVGELCYECVHGTNEPPSFCPHAMLLKDGKEHAVEIVDDRLLKGTFLVTTSPLFGSEGQLIGSVHVARDISERKLSEERLKESERRLRTIFENATDVITYVDKSGRVVDVNERVEEILGYQREEIAGKSFVELDVIRQEDIPRLIWLFESTLLEGQAIERIELELKHKKGGTVPVEIGTRFILNDGEVEEVVNIIRDITERKQTEIDLARAKQAAEAASRAKSEFLANISHEIRTPLTAIVGFADLLMTPELSPEEHRRHLETIHANAGNLLKLIDDMLDLSKIEAEKLQIEPVEFPPWELVEEVRSMMGLRASEKNLDLRVDYQFPLPEKICTDPVRLRQILVNLVGNAVKFTESGEVRVTVRCICPPGSAARLEFSVSDTGVGMRSEDLGRLFEPFTQIDMSSSRRFGGSGLGLSISQRLAAMLGGSIEPQSRLGEGSTFVLSIDPGPLEEVGMVDRLPDPVTPTADAEAHAVDRSLSGRVLVVEDSQDVRQLIRLLLEQSEVRVDLAENGRIGFEKALASADRGSPYDLILMDIQMPVMDGLEATRQLRQKDWKGPIVALTAHAMAGDRTSCTEAGCDDYIAKPIRSAQLLDTVGRFLSKDDSGTLAAGFLSSARLSDAQKAMLLGQFLDTLDERAAEIQKALAQGSVKLLCETVHMLYGTAGMLGFHSIGRLARQIEEQVRGGAGMHDVRPLAEQLVRDCRQVLVENGRS